MLIYKIVDRTSWEAAEKAGFFIGSAIDVTDGFIHFSTGIQAPETARRHFHGQSDLVLVAVEAYRLGPQLRFEASRGGDLFPHLYARLNVTDVVWVKPLPLGPDGRHRFPLEGSE